jgi:hypothetical protein
MTAPARHPSRILPALRASGATAKDVGAATGLTSISCYRVLSGAQVPAAEHWPSLAELTGLTLSRPGATVRAKRTGA